MADPKPPKVSFKRFSGQPNKKMNQLEGLFRSVITVVRIVEAQNRQAQYLHLQLGGKALNFNPNLDETAQNDLG